MVFTLLIIVKNQKPNPRRVKIIPAPKIVIPVNLNNNSAGKFIKYWLPVIICAILIFYLSSLTGEDIPGLFIGQDIIGHLAEYAIFALLLSRALKAYNLKLNYNKRILWVCVIAIIYAMSDEFHQMFVSGRVASFFDLLLDAIGSLTGGLLYRWQK